MLNRVEIDTLISPQNLNNNNKISEKLKMNKSGVFPRKWSIPPQVRNKIHSSMQLSITTDVGEARVGLVTRRSL